MRRRLVYAFTAFTLLVLLVQNVPFALFLYQVERDRLTTGLQRDAFLLAGRFEDDLIDGVVDETALRALLAYTDSTGGRVVVVNAAGRAVATSDTDQSKVGASYATRPEFETALRGSISSGERYSETLQQELVYVAVPVVGADHVLGAVRISHPANEFAAVARKQLKGLIGVSVITVLLAAGIAALLATGVTRSLRRLREVTEAIAAGAIDARVENIPGTPEVRSLSHSFNVMADRLNRLIDTQRNFAADASHQLRTPLTALRIQLENARDAIADQPESAVERIADAEAELQRLNALVEGLLSLSRAELAQAKTTQQDIAAIALDRVEQWEPLAKESDVGIEYDGPKHALAYAVETAAEQIIDNCLDNAIAASPAGSTITVKVHVTKDHVTVHVIDEGCGMTDEEVDRAFDRFWRGTSNSSGTGLGLAIVDQLARASGTRAHIKRRPTVGLDVYVDFRTAIATEPR